jgi:hypothetical protein
MNKKHILILTVLIVSLLIFNACSLQHPNRLIDNSGQNQGSSNIIMNNVNTNNNEPTDTTNTNDNTDNNQPVSLLNNKGNDEDNTNDDENQDDDSDETNEEEENNQEPESDFDIRISPLINDNVLRGIITLTFTDIPEEFDGIIIFLYPEDSDDPVEDPNSLIHIMEEPFNEFFAFDSSDYENGHYILKIAVQYDDDTTTDDLTEMYEGSFELDN